MSPLKTLQTLGWITASLLLAACVGGGTGSDPVGTITTREAPQTNPQTRFDPANACYNLQLVDGSAAGQFLARSAPGRYGLVADASKALPIYFKPTALGQYLLSLPDSQLITASNAVGEAATPSDAADWTLDAPTAGRFTLKSFSGQSLVVNPAAASSANASVLGLGSQPTVLALVPATGCRTYPEITTNVSGDSFQDPLNNGQVLGFADAHVHISATDFLGGAHYGSPFHRFGVTHAVGNCDGRHGPDGRLDLVGNLLAGTPEATHDTVGWPSFASWPAAHALTHEGMYYKWVERAWKSGLRIMVNELVENEVLCTINSVAKLKPQNCNEMNTVYTQAKFMQSLQDYIDAQEGGPGKGWFRLVKTPDEARQVIRAGKLAVVLGVEISHILNCSVRQIAGQSALDVNNCSQASIDAEIDKLHAAGIRQIFPVHEFDNALGGNGIFDGLVLNVGNFLDTGSFWSTYDCPVGTKGDPVVDERGYFGGGFYTAGTVMTTSLGSIPKNPVTDGLYTLLSSTPGLSGLAGQLLSGGLTPVYVSTKPQCNKRSMTALGKYAISRMMDKGMVIDLDHMELKMKSEVIDLAMKRKAGDERYPLTSTHGGHGGISFLQAQQIFELGGLIYGYKGNGQGYQDGRLGALKAYQASGSKKPFAYGYGADTNGLGAQADPRSNTAKPVKYPFTLFSGNDWDSSLFRGVSALKVDQQKSGERLYATDKDGMAHYGLIADFVEEVRLEGGKAALNDLYRSAEVYLQMWEQAIRVGTATKSR